MPPPATQVNTTGYQFGVQGGPQAPPPGTFGFAPGFPFGGHSIPQPPNGMMGIQPGFQFSGAGGSAIQLPYQPVAYAPGSASGSGVTAGSSALPGSSGNRSVTASSSAFRRVQKLQQKVTICHLPRDVSLSRLSFGILLLTLITDICYCRCCCRSRGAMRS